MDYIDIAFALNKNIYLSLLTTINSIIKNTNKPENIRFNIVVPLQEILFFRNEIEQTFPNSVFSLRIETFTPPKIIENYLNCKYKELSPDRRMSRNMQFARFFLKDIFPDITKIIYLDTDLVVLRDISKLFSIFKLFSQDQYFAAAPQVLPPIGHFTNPLEGLKQIQGMKLSFNSGVFLTDFSYWNQETYSRLAYYLKLEGQYNYNLYRVGDETILNLMFKNVIPLDRNWNRSGYGNAKVVARFLQCDLKKANIIHWSGGFHKPWNTHDIIYGELWKKYSPYQTQNRTEIFLQKSNASLGEGEI